MKKQILSIVLALAIVVPIIAVGGCKPEEVVQPEQPVKEWTWPTGIVRMGTPTSWSSTYMTCSAWTAVMEADTGLRWRLVPEATSANLARWMKMGELEFWASYQDVPYAVITAKHGYAARDSGPMQIRIVATMDMNATALTVMGDSPIKSFEDIKDGTKMAVWSGSPTLIDVWEAMEAYTGKKLTRVEFGGYSSFCRSISEGKADINWISPFAPAYMELEASPRGIRDIEYPDDPEGLARYYEKYPSPIAVVDFDFPLKGLRCLITWTELWTLDETDPGLVYHIVKWLYDPENYVKYKEKHPGCAYITLEQFAKNLKYAFYPVHEGTKRYLKEKGLWTPYLELRDEYNTKLLNWYIKAYDEAIKRADDRGIRVDPANEEWVKLWEEYKQEIGIFKYKAELTEEEMTGRLRLMK